MLLYLILASITDWCSLKHIITFSVERQWLASRWHVVFMLWMKACCCVRWVMNVGFVEKKRSLTTLFIMCTITRSSWWDSHHTKISRHSPFITLLRQITTPPLIPVVPRAPSENCRVHERSNWGTKWSETTQLLHTWVFQYASYLKAALQHEQLQCRQMREGSFEI